MQKAAVQAEILKGMQAPQVGPQVPAGVQAQDTQGSGGGMMGTGTAPVPGEQGFSGNTGGGEIGGQPQAIG